MDEEQGVERLAGDPLDDADVATLDLVRASLDVRDPVPPGLVERIGFALALDEVFSEVARITREPVDELAVRGTGSSASTMRTQTLTFSAQRLSALVTLTGVGPAQVRVDGWLTPPGSHRVRLLRRDAGAQETETDVDGRFSFAAVPEGLVQLGFDAAEGSVVTPLFEL